VGLLASAQSNGATLLAESLLGWKSPCFCVAAGMLINSWVRLPFPCSCSRAREASLHILEAGQHDLRARRLQGNGRSCFCLPVGWFRADALLGKDTGSSLQLAAVLNGLSMRMFSSKLNRDRVLSQADLRMIRLCKGSFWKPSLIALTTFPSACSEALAGEDYISKEVLRAPQHWHHPPTEQH